MTTTTDNMETENTTPVTNISIYIAALQTVYKPALPGKATHYFSTDEVHDAIKALDPAAKIDKNAVFQAMLDGGYKFEPRPGTQRLDFRWLLQAKS